MNRLRRLSFWIAGLGASSSLLAVAACSTTNDPLDLDPAVPDATPDVSSTDAPSDDVRDGGAEADVIDARRPFDPTEEVVTCATEPCPKRIVAGADHFCVLMSDKTIRCWGSSEKGELGTFTPAPEPFAVGKADGITNAIQLSAAASTTCAVLEDGTLRCWGGNDSGQLGLGVDPPISDSDPHPTPAQAAVTGNVTRVDVGQRSVCAVLASRDVWCWGSNERGLLARPSDVWIGGPAKLPALTGTTVRTGAGTHTSFAIDDQGAITSWGAVAGIEGSIAGRVASTSPDRSPGKVSAGPFTSFAVSSWFSFQPPYSGSGPFPSTKGIAHACGVVGGTVYCWGESTLGAVGTGMPKLVVSPTPIVTRGDAYAQQVAIARENTCVRLTDGTIQCAGDNAHGQLGRSADGGATFGDYFEPATTFTGQAVQVAVSNQTTCALVQGGTVACWGGNSHGELGQGTSDEDPHPTPVTVVF